jgi:twinkle protein
MATTHSQPNPSDVWGYVSGKGQWRRSGDEAVGICPRCNGGPKREKCLSVNLTTGQWCCNRKNNCGQQGGFPALQELFGDQRQPRHQALTREPVTRTYTKPERKPGQLGDAGAAFLASRGLNELTIAAWRCGQDKLTGVGESVSWPVFNPAGELVNVKYRGIHTKDFRNAKGAQKLPVGLHTVKGAGRLILVEGELDAMSGYQYGLRNIVSVPNGTSDCDWVEDLWEYLTGFREIVIALDMDEAGAAAVRKLVKRLGAARCSGVTLPGGHKDLNECLMAGAGAEAIKAAFDAPHEFPVADLRFADGYLDELLAEKARPASRVGTLTGWAELDDSLKGFRDGEITIWSGYNGAGKSTVLGWLVNVWAGMGVRSCVASMELKPLSYLKWIAMQALGGDWDALSNDDITRWNAWVSPSFALLNHPASIHLDKMIEVFVYAAQRYNCKQFIADNLMKIITPGDPMESQRRIVTALKDFAIEWDCHVHIVAHPRKPPATGAAKMTRYDISGTSDIPNLADNVLIVNRTRHTAPPGQAQPADVTTIKVDKNREHGTEPEFQVYVNETSKGVYAMGGRRNFRDLIFLDDDIPAWSDAPPQRNAFDWMETSEPLTERRPA